MAKVVSSEAQAKELADWLAPQLGISGLAPMGFSQYRGQQVRLAITDGCTTARQQGRCAGCRQLPKPRRKKIIIDDSGESLVVRLRGLACPDGRVHWDWPEEIRSAAYMTTRAIVKFLIVACDTSLGKAAKRFQISRNLASRLMTAFAKELDRVYRPKLGPTIGMDVLHVGLNILVLCEVVRKGLRGARVIDIYLYGKGKHPTLKRKVRALDGIEHVLAVAMDGSRELRKLARALFISTLIVLDKRHCLADFMKAAATVRRHLAKPLRQRRVKMTTQGRRGDPVKRLMERTEDRLTPEQRKELRRIRREFPAIDEVMTTLTKLRAIFKVKSRTRALAKIETLLASVNRRGPCHLYTKGFFKFLKEWQEEVANYIDHPITTSYVERRVGDVKALWRLTSGNAPFAHNRARIIAQFGQISESDLTKVRWAVAESF